MTNLPVDDRADATRDSARLPLMAAQACIAFGFCAAAVALLAPPPHWYTWLGAGFLISAPLTWLVMRERAADAQDRPRLLIPAARPILIVVMIVAALAALSRTREFVYKERHDFAPAVLGVISIGCGIYSITSLDRRRIAQEDAWRAARRSERSPELVAAKQRNLAKRLSATRARPAAVGPREHFGARPESTLERLLERGLVVYLAVALLVALPLGPPAIVAGIAVAHAWLALLDALEARRFDGPRLPVAASELRAAATRIRKGRGVWAASPPATLRRMRIAFCVLVVLAIAFGIARLALSSGDPAAEGAPAWWFPACLAFALPWQWLAETSQARSERRWLATRDAETARAS